MQQIVAALAEQQDELAGFVAGIGEDDWARPSACEGWTVADVLLHLAQTNEMAIGSATGRFAEVQRALASGARPATSVDDGADAIVAQGWEAGGHVHGAVATMALVPAVVDRVAPVPVLAAGGIADGRGLAAAMALGAAGAWIGTRFLASDEAEIHPLYRDRLLAAQETDTVYGTLFDVGWPDAPHRTLRNKTIEAWEDAGRAPTGKRPREGVIVAKSPDGDIVAYQAHTPGALDGGDIDALSLWSGQGVGLVRRVQPAAEIVHEIWHEGRATLARLAGNP